MKQPELPALERAKESANSFDLGFRFPDLTQLEVDHFQRIGLRNLNATYL